MIAHGRVTSRQKRVVRALYLANQWSADASSSPLGTAMLSLGTTRTIHSEEHRAAAVNEIQVNIETVIRWSRDGNGPPDCDNSDIEVARLADLWSLVVAAKIGEPWISYHDNLRVNEMLFRSGQL